MGYTDDPDDPGYRRTSHFLSAAAGIFIGGASVGAILAGWIGDALGRKLALQLSSLIYILGGSLQSGARDPSMFLAARFLSGVGMGTFLAIVPMYQAEVATPESRGFMVSTTGVMFAIGNALAAWINVGTYFKGVGDPKSEFAWRFPLAVQLLPAVILLAGSPILPASPRWLIQRDRHEEALAILRRLHGHLGDEAGNYAMRQYNQMSKQIAFDRGVSEKIGRFPIVRTASNRKRVFLAFNLLWGTQFLGLTTVGIYGVLVYESLGMTGPMPLILQAIWVSISIPGNFINAILVDHVGRRALLLCGTCGILVCVVLNAILQGLYVEPQYGPGLKASVFVTFLMICFWSTCIDSTQFVYISEIFPSYIRAPGQAIGTLGLTLSNVILLVAAPIALAAIHWKFYLVNICWTVLFIATIYLCYPESTGKSIEDLSTLFGDTVVVSFERAILDGKAGACEDDQAPGQEVEKEAPVVEQVELRF
jgi:sugar porter (SP) family MFS transporter